MMKARQMMMAAICLMLICAVGYAAVAQDAAPTATPKAKKTKKAKKAKTPATEDAFLKTFGEDKADLLAEGKNDYFSIEPGTVTTFEGTEGGKPAKLVITVLAETKMVDGVKTRIVEEKASENGQLVELARNYFVYSKKTGNIYYFGEDTKEYDKTGKVTSTEGSWESGKNGATYGMIMPAKPKVGEKYYQEIALKDKAADRAETMSLSEKIKVPAGTYENCLKTKETSAVENLTEYKIYAPGVGLVQDGELLLVKIEKLSDSPRQ